MRGKGAIVCSVFELNGTQYARFVTVPSIDAYQAMLALVYPERAWNLDEHRAWYNINLMESMHDGLAELMCTTNGCTSVGPLLFASCDNIDSLRTRVFEGVHAFFMKMFDEHVDEDTELMAEAAMHKYANLCQLEAHDIKWDSGELGEYMPLRKPVPIKFKLTSCATKDPWNKEYPYVWSLDALKDLIFLVQQLQIYELAKQTRVPETTNEPVFWAVDDICNIRSRDTHHVLNANDICALFDLLGTVPKAQAHVSLAPQFLSPFLTVDSACYTTEKMCSAVSLEDAPIVPAGLVARQPYAPMFGYESIDDLQVQTKNQTQTQIQTQKEVNEVHVLANILTKRVWCEYVNKRENAASILPDVKVLATVPTATKSEGTNLLHEFAFVFEPVPHMKLVELIKAASIYISDTSASQQKAQTNAHAHSNNNEAPTVRSMIEFLVKTMQLVPTTVWTPSSTIINSLQAYLEALRKANPTVFGHLVCQRNQLSIILADVVPKKRFVAGQMFQVQPCTNSIINDAILRLPVKYSTVNQLDLSLAKTMVRPKPQVAQVQQHPWGIITSGRTFTSLQS